MIVSPQNPGEWSTLARFMHEFAHVQPTPDMAMIAWIDEDRVRIVAALTGFLGKLAQIHIAFAPGWHYSPRTMLKAVFNYAFVDRKLELLVGIVNSNNQRALQFDRHLGFHELYRIPGMHDEGGDVVVLGMYAHECRYLDKEGEHGDSASFYAGHAIGHA